MKISEIVIQIFSAIFAFGTSQIQTDRILIRVRRSILTTVFQTILLGIFGAVLTSFMTRCIRKDIKRFGK